jgi:hypothetical protein
MPTARPTAIAGVNCNALTKQNRPRYRVITNFQAPADAQITIKRVAKVTQESAPKTSPLCMPKTIALPVGQKAKGSTPQPK